MTRDRWRAEPFKKSSYWIVTDTMGVSKTTDKNRGIDLQRYKIGNYFENQRLAMLAANKLIIVLKEKELNSQQILEKAIGIAIQNGFDGKLAPVMVYDKDGNQRLEQYRLLFWHKFAKALWGEELSGYINNGKQGLETYPLKAWQYHLQQMVMADDPIKYLEDHL